MTRTQYLLVSLFSLSLVVFAVLLQQFGYQNTPFLPCPLCILQRIGYLGIAFACLLAAGPSWSKTLFHFFAVISAAFGAIIAGKQVWLLSHPESSCGIDPLEVWINQFQLAQHLPWLFKADGICSAKLPAIFGLQLPEWSLIWFCALLILLVVTLIKNIKAK